jgi:hypothetical protein
MSLPGFVLLMTFLVMAWTFASLVVGGDGHPR